MPTKRRYASHFLFHPEKGWLKLYAVEVERGNAVRIFPLEGEAEDVEWLPGAIRLVREDGVFASFYFPDFDFKAMQPFCETRHIRLK